MPLLTVNNVTVNALSTSLKPMNKVLVDNVSCSLAAGQILSVIGPNGAGKSTLLKAIAGDLSYYGEISIAGLSDEATLRARQIAVLPQLSLLNFPYRVFEVVELARIPHGTGKRRDAEIVRDALKLMDVDYLEHRLYTDLSGGEKQRVQLARVLAQIWDPEDAPNGTRLLLLDEPITALDLGHQQQLMQAIQLFADQGVAVLMVLHDINLAAHYSDQLLALLCSQRLDFGTPEDVINVENIKSLFSIDASIIKHPEHNTPVVIGL